MNHAAYANKGALWPGLTMEAVEQQKLDSVPNAEGVTSGHRFPFGLGMTLPFSPSYPTFATSFVTQEQLTVLLVRPLDRPFPSPPTRSLSNAQAA